MNTCYFFLARNLFAQQLPPDEDEFIEIISHQFDESQRITSTLAISATF